MQSGANVKTAGEVYRRLSYGLFVLTTRDGKDNGCIVNTVSQVASAPERICVSVNKSNYTCETVMKTGIFNACILSADVPFSVFTRFGFQSGRTVDKFSRFDAAKRSENGLLYLTEFSNSYISAKLCAAVDCGSHMLFVGDVTGAEVLNGEASVTYADYFAKIKPKPAPREKKGFVCKICGYVYKGDELPPDFICPVCKHPAEDFEPIV